MPNVIALVKDDRVRRQIEFFLNELDMDNLRFATFKSQDEFQALYFRERKEEAEPPVEGQTDPEGAELKLFSEVNLVIFALDTVDGRSGRWIDQLRASMKKFKYLPEGGQLRLILLKFEEDGISKLDLLHPFLDDLIYLPLDRLVFLQKLQILLALPKRATPTYLFNQEVQQPIEISKIAKLDRLSDVGLAIRNPVPLKKGLPGHFYITAPGEKNRIEIKAKVLRSEPHPEHPGQFLVYFTYFGLNKNALSYIRRALSKSPQYKSLLFDDRERFRYQPDLLFMDESERQSFGVVIIDTDETACNSMAQMLSKEMDRLNVMTESSYQMFLHRFFSSAGTNAESNTPPKATDASDFYHNPITLTVSLRDLKCLTVEPGPSETSLFLGHPAIAIFSSPDKWISLVQEKQSRLILEEAAQIANSGRDMEKLFPMQDAHNQRCAVNFKITHGVSEGTVTIRLSPATLMDIVAKMSSESHAKNLDAMIVDTAFVPGDQQAWVEGLRSQALRMGMIKDLQDLKFWLIAEKDSQAQEAWLNSPDFLGLYLKPVDQRQLVFSMSENLGNKNTIYQFDNLGWSSPGFSVHVAKAVELEALSEFGATLKSKQQLLPGSMLYLRKSIYENAPNGCLAARVYACGEHPKDKSYFQIFTTYFGINEAFLKFARTWIRENYAHQKTQG